MEFSRENMQKAAEEMATMSPDDLRREAESMRSNPSRVRASVPAMAGLSDAQICGAADNLERMADDAALRQATISKVNGMQDTDVDQIKSVLAAFAVGDRVEIFGLVGAPQHNGRQGTVRGFKGERVSVTVEADLLLALKPTNLKKLPPQQQQQAPEMTPAGSVDLGRHASALRQMDGGKLAEQARALRAMPPAQLRASNRWFAQMTDEQLREALDQMEAMAHNPQLRAAAAQQMDSLGGLTAEQLQQQATDAQQGVQEAAAPEEVVPAAVPEEEEEEEPAVVEAAAVEEEQEEIKERSPVTTPVSPAPAAAAPVVTKERNALLPVMYATILFIITVTFIGFAAASLRGRRSRQREEYFKANYPETSSSTEEEL